MNCIKSPFRPNLSIHKDNILFQIIMEHDEQWLTPDKTRAEMVDKIFELWSKYEILDDENKNVECLICNNNLTNGDNTTFTCGHKFHSSCIIQSLIIRSTDKIINIINKEDDNKQSISYKCAQCNNIIYDYPVNKSTFIHNSQ